MDCSCWWIFSFLPTELSPCQILVVEGVDVVPPDRSHPDQRAVQPRHRCVHLLHVVVAYMLFCPVVHLEQQNLVEKVLGQFCTGQLSNKQLSPRQSVQDNRAQVLGVRTKLSTQDS